IQESYDGDMTCYFSCDEVEAGKTLEELHESVKKALEDDYSIEVKASALRVRAKHDWNNDLHIDVVPGRYIDETKLDVFLHRTTGNKQRLKTNLQTHIDHIKDSGVRDAIRLIKLWKVRNGIVSAKTFVLELLVIKLLEKEKSLDLSLQLQHIWAKFRDAADSLSVEDPANANNDLKPSLDQCRLLLSSAASTTLWQIENKGWEAVFGKILEEDNDQVGNISTEEIRSNALQSAVSSVQIETKLWCHGL
ncbi:MAG: hypothetical protein WCD18_26705, partial [Thermosynechococcaceae cyanobacterium]